MVPLLAELQYWEYNKYIDGTSDYIECLLKASLKSQEVIDVNTGELIEQSVNHVSDYVDNICGSYPPVRPALGLIISAICWYAAYGIIPAVVFGAGPCMVDCCCVSRDTTVLSTSGTGNGSNSGIRGGSVSGRGGRWRTGSSMSAGSAGSAGSNRRSQSSNYRYR